jgi:N6-adenosine-specific RNA methylase IME4
MAQNIHHVLIHDQHHNQKLSLHIHTTVTDHQTFAVFFLSFANSLLKHSTYTLLTFGFNAFQFLTWMFCLR